MYGNLTCSNDNVRYSRFFFFFFGLLLGSITESFKKWFNRPQRISFALCLCRCLLSGSILCYIAALLGPTNCDLWLFSSATRLFLVTLFLPILESDKCFKGKKLQVFTSWATGKPNSFCSRSSWPKDQTMVSCFAGGFFTNWAIREAYIYIYFFFFLSKKIALCLVFETCCFK